MFDPPDSPHPASTSFNHLTRSILSYNGSVMLAAIISLLLVILFVLLLHIYAKWFLAEARHRRRNSIVVADVFGPPRFHHFHTFTFDTSVPNCLPKGLEASMIASIPLFAYKSQERDDLNLDCVVCLSDFQDGDVGRKLPKCGHGFHVECIDMWLYSHSSCPICRVPIVAEKNIALEKIPDSITVISVDEILTSQNSIDAPISHNENVAAVDSSLPLSPSESPSSSLSCSLKRTLSRKKSESKVQLPSTNVHELCV